MDISDLALSHMNRISKNEKLGYLSILEKKIYGLMETTFPEGQPATTNNISLDILIKIEQLRQLVDK